jgi:hypothetical protein
MGWIGSVAAASLFAIAGCGVQPNVGTQSQAIAPERNITVTPETPTAMCPSTTSCFDITTEPTERNLTQIFVDLESCQFFPAATVISVTVDDQEIDLTKVITHLHPNGGPCNHGEDLIDRDFWFPLPGNNDMVKVCVTTDQPTSVSVGVKSQDDCVFNSSSGCICPCPQNNPT